MHSKILEVAIYFPQYFRNQALRTGPEELIFGDALEVKITIMAPLVDAVLKLLNDEDLIINNPGEPVLTSELYHLMKNAFPGWRVNHLYDRREAIQKRLHYLKPDGLMKNAPIIPDIIVHRVGMQENLLVVEAKRYPNQDDGDDVWKLEGLTADGAGYGYKLGIHITFNVPKRVITNCAVYSNGTIDDDASAWLRKNLPE